MAEIARHARQFTDDGEKIMEKIKNTEASTTETASPFYNTVESLLESYNHCGFCGSNLHFTHVTDFTRNLTQETARCPECGVKARQLQHKLQ
ncbi:MAG: hypothetical protein P4M08_07565 [Oligoflexia bacterium]|nr:hypothetical protein [Oligoflexia bacterium]